MESLREITKESYKEIREKGRNFYLNNKIVKRVGVFETNSSSCHSIVYTGKEGGNVNPNNTYGEGEYGWGYDSYNSPSDKLDYMIVMLGQHKSGMNEIYLQNILNVLKEKEGNDFILKIYNGDWLNFKGISIEGIEIIESEDRCGGYIDHQSEFTLDFIFKSKDIEKAIEEFIYGKAVIEIDNDNH